MAKVVTDNRFYKEIAETIRLGQGSNVLCKPERMADEIKGAYATQYSMGTGFGREEAERECAEKHYVASFVGDGTGTAKFHVPFKPDCIAVFGMSPFNYKRAHSVAYFTADLKTFGYVGAVNGAHRSNGNMTSQPVTTKSIPLLYEQDADGFVTLSGLVGDGTAGKGFFPTDAEYIVLAAKHTDKTDKQYLDDFVKNLDASGGTVTLCKERVETVYPDASAGTNAEWNALITPEEGEAKWTITLL